MKKRWLSLVLCTVAVLAFSCTKEKKEFLANCENENTHAYQLVFTKMNAWANVVIYNKTTRKQTRYTIYSKNNMRDNYIILSNDTSYSLNISALHMISKDKSEIYDTYDNEIINSNLFESCEIVKKIRF